MEKPLIELVDEQEFTNREKELKKFWNLAMKAKRKNGSSFALIARKGVGKTAVLMRLYNDLFTKQDEVVPFFLTFAPYKEPSEKLTVTIFNEYYFTTVIKQYIAFRLRRPEMVEDSIDLDILSDLVMKNGLEELEKWFISYQRLHNDSLEAVRRMVAQMTFYLMHKQAGLLMIDEFQLLTQVWDEVLGMSRDTTGVFQRPAEAKWCPMLVSGSAVSLTEQTVLTSVLARRFRLDYLEPFEQNHTVEYVSKLAHINHLNCSDEVMSTIQTLTGGNPFYIKCLLDSDCLEDNNLSTPEKLLKVYEDEISQKKGSLRDFWDTHFSVYGDKLNGEDTVAKAMYFLSLHPGKDIGTHEIAEAIGENTVKTRKILQNLYDADLVERNSLWRYVGITDPVLADYIKRVYKEQIERQSSEEYQKFLEEEYWKKLGSLNRRIGELAELYLMMLMEKFNHQFVDAKKVFGIDEGKVKLPLFNGKIEKRSGKIIEGHPIEFDLIARSEQENWFVEVKYWKKPVGKDEVEKFLKKLEEIDLEESKTLVAWFFSRNGFQKEALERLQASKIRHSDTEGFNEIADAVGCVKLP
jgi:predicted transcriptional regulator